MGAAPFGLDLDRDKLSLACHNGKTTPYPIAYINLCNLGDKTRIIPPENNGSIMLKKQDLDLLLTFGTGGSTTDVSYAMYIYWTTFNLVYDIAKNHFFNPFLKNKT